MSVSAPSVEGEATPEPMSGRASTRSRAVPVAAGRRRRPNGTNEDGRIVVDRDPGASRSGRDRSATEARIGGTGGADRSRSLRSGRASRSCVSGVTVAVGVGGRVAVWAASLGRAAGARSCRARRSHGTSEHRHSHTARRRLARRVRAAGTAGWGAVAVRVDGPGALPERSSGSDPDQTGRSGRAKVEIPAGRHRRPRRGRPPGSSRGVWMDRPQTRTRGRAAAAQLRSRSRVIESRVRREVASVSVSASVHCFRGAEGGAAELVFEAGLTLGARRAVRLGSFGAAEDARARVDG